MNLSLSLRPIPIAVWLVVGLVLMTTLLTTIGKPLFVGQKGNLGFSELLVPILTIALLFKWKYARTILGWLHVIAIAGVISIFVVQHHIDTGVENLPILPYMVLVLLFLVLCYLLFFSKSVKQYVES